jgi:hypothetical protein
MFHRKGTKNEESFSVQAATSKSVRRTAISAIASLVDYQETED